MSTTEIILLVVGAVLWPLLGALGTGIEKYGEKKENPILVAIGQRMEAVFADFPKFLHGSRLSNASIDELQVVMKKQLEKE